MEIDERGGVIGEGTAGAIGAASAGAGGGCVRRVREVVLLTDDRNLRVKALAAELPARDLPAFLQWAALPAPGSTPGPHTTPNTSGGAAPSGLLYSGPATTTLRIDHVNTKRRLSNSTLTRFGLQNDVTRRVLRRSDVTRAEGVRNCEGRSLRTKAERRTRPC
ncbi:hypothetical protein EVAR_74625_1 [Eumeta japonica]|uniref:PIN domain-containing protein n=1 Tax=Eumeta variegata TaxID=151549 RepID=A0A4C1WB49_EUMVA|nr:hypothetical protein EVAR_74625_1 [Eumeta japonica]